MRIEGYIEKSDKYWAVSIPLLLIYTQGKSKKNAYEMAKDAIEELVDEKGFSVDIHPSTSLSFSVGSNNESMLMAFALKQQRLHHGLSIREVVANMGLKSPTAYSRYEKGLVRPSLDKFSELLCGISGDLEPILKIG